MCLDTTVMVALVEGTLKKSKSVKQAAATAYQKVALTADVSAYILHATVRDSALELPEHAA